MSLRRDVTELELAQLRMKATRVMHSGEPWMLSRLDAERIIRLTGEVSELRNREAAARLMHQLEGEY